MTVPTSVEEARQRLIERVRPRCPPFIEVKTVEDMLPYLDAVARRPYHPGLWPAWELKENERVLLKATNWHDPMVIEAVEEILKRYKTKYKIEIEDKGDVPKWVGADEVEYYLQRTRELMRWMDDWEEWDAKGTYDKVLQGYGGPVLAERKIKIQRMPFITPEMVVTPAHTIPAEVL